MRSAVKTLTQSHFLRLPLPLSSVVFSQVAACTLVRVIPYSEDVDVVTGAIRRGLGAVMGFCHLLVRLLGHDLIQSVPSVVEASLVQVEVEAVRQQHLAETRTTTSSSRLVLEVLEPLAEITHLS
jgi:hypothetical protein